MKEPQHKFRLSDAPGTRRCVKCGLHELQILAGAACELQTVRRVVIDGVIVEGPEA